jgi:hypothetical protein
MTNYVTQFLPVLQPKDWMKVEVGLADGVYGITLGDLRKYLLGESFDSGSNNSGSTSNESNPDYEVDASPNLFSKGLNFYSDKPTNWKLTGFDNSKLTITPDTGKVNVKLNNASDITSNIDIFIRGYDNTNTQVYIAKLSILV